MTTARQLVPGLAVVIVVTAVATLLGAIVPVVGAPVFAVALGLCLAGRVNPRPAVLPGLRFASRQLLQTSVVLLGCLLSVRQLLHVGGQSLPVIVTTLAVAGVATVLLTRVLRIRPMLAALIGAGTAICGASAIAALAAVLEPEERDVAFSVSTIFAFNVAAVLVFPPLGHAMGLTQHGFGLWAGTAVNDTSSVVAAATVYGAAATRYAVVVKLTRSLAIIPLSVGAAVLARRSASAPGIRLTRIVPPFMLLFVLAAAANSAGLIPAAAGDGLHHAATILITAALAGIGLSTSIGAMRAAGARPLLMGASLWILVALSSLGVQWLTGTI